MSVIKVSVVIPNYNYGPYLSKALDSVLQQTRQDFEVIVVDNFSTDSSLRIAEEKRSEKIRFVQFENKGSIAAARNKGVSLARGEYIAFLDSDDYWLKSKLSEQLKRMEVAGGVSFHNLKLFGDRKFGTFRGWSVGRDPLRALVSGGNPIATSSVMVSRSAFEQAGGFPEDQALISVEDFALWLKMADLGTPFTHVNKVLGGYRVHSGVTSKSDSPARAEALISDYLHRVSEEAGNLASGFISYAKGVRMLQLNQRNLARVEFRRALKLGASRFRWRALVRLIQLSLKTGEAS
jgi:glycosyltransferase involved in cell wall biosynthesis